jgi:hypothetical protein
MGQYMAYNQNTQPYEWPPVPGSTAAAGGRETNKGADSRRSTVSRTTDDEAVAGAGQGGNDPTSDKAGSRSNSPKDTLSDFRMTQQRQPLGGFDKVLEEEDEGEEKMDHRKRKRNRTIRSCVPCHNHKRKVGLPWRL